MPESAISGSCMTKDECSFYEMFLKEGGFMNWKISKTLQQRAEACADSEEVRAKHVLSISNLKKKIFIANNLLRHK